MTDGRPPDSGKLPRRWIGPGAVGPLILAGIALLLVLGLILFGREQPPERAAEKAEIEQVQEEEAQDRSCASQAAYDLIKGELFRRAAQIRGSDHQAFEQLSAYAALRVEPPVVTERDDNLGLVNCRAMASLDLPPGVAVVGGRRTLAAPIDYSLQIVADEGRTVLTLGNVEAITVPLATLARTAQRVEEQPDAAVPPPLLDQPLPQPSPTPEPPPQSSGVSPSFDCRYARTRGEIAVCGDPGLAALDRQMAAAYGQAYGQANERQRELLVQTRSRFLAYRDRCRSNSCIANAYRGRMREIADIIAGRWSLDR